MDAPSTFGRTLHGAGPNRSDDPRYAYVLIFNVPPTEKAGGETFPWLQNKNTARMQRSKAWMQHGGRFVNLWRRIRNKEIRDYKRTFLKMKTRLFASFRR